MDFYGIWYCDFCSKSCWVNIILIYLYEAQIEFYQFYYKRLIVQIVGT